MQCSNLLVYSTYNTSEQHKDLTTARQGEDMADSCEILVFLESGNPFQ